MYQHDIVGNTLVMETNNWERDTKWLCDLEWVILISLGLMVSNKIRNGIGFDLLALTFCDPKVYPVDLDILQASVPPEKFEKQPRNFTYVDKKKKGVGLAQKLHTLGIVALLNIISLLDDVSYHLSEFIFIHKNQVVSGTLYLTTLVKETLILHSEACSHEKFSWNTAGCSQPFPSLQRQRQMLVEAFGPYFQTEWSSSIKGPGRWGGTGGPNGSTLPPSSHSHKWKAVTWEDIKTDLSASPNFPSGGFHRLDWATGSLCLKSKQCPLIQPLSQYGRYSILYLLSLFLISQLVQKMDQERKCDHWSILKPQLQPWWHRDSEGLQECWMVSFTPPCSTNNPSGSFLHLNEVISGYNSMVVGGGSGWETVAPKENQP